MINVCAMVLRSKWFILLFLLFFRSSFLWSQAEKTWLRHEYPTLVAENSLFVGTPNGLYQYHLEEDTWTTYGTQNGLPDNRLCTLFWDGEWLWAATSNGAACGDIHLNQWLVFSKENGLPSNTVLSFAVQGDYVWIGTDRGAARFDKLIQEWERFTVQKGLSDSSVYDMAVDGDQVYFATAKGLSEYDTRFEKWRYYGVREGIASDTIRFVYPSGEFLWLFTDGGISRFSKKLHTALSFTGDPRLHYPQIRDMAVDGEQMWLATNDGVVVYDPSIAMWRDFPEQTNLPSRSVIALAFSQDSRWFLTDRGLILNNVSLKTWQPFDKTHGMSSDRYDAASLFMGRPFLINAGTIDHYRPQENRWYVHPLRESDRPSSKKSDVFLGRLEEGYVQFKSGLKMGLSGTRFTVRQEKSFEYDLNRRSLSESARRMGRGDLKAQIVLPGERTFNGFYDNTDFSQTFYGVKYQGRKVDVLQEASWGDIRYEQGRSSLIPSLGLFGLSGRAEIGKKTERYQRSLFSARAFSGERTTASETDFFTGNLESGTFILKENDFIRNTVYRIDTVGIFDIPHDADVQVYVDDGNPATNTANTSTDYSIDGTRGDFDRLTPVLDYRVDKKSGEVWFSVPLSPLTAAGVRIVAQNGNEERILKKSGEAGFESVNHYAVGGMEIIPSSFRMTVADSFGIAMDLSEFALDCDHDGQVDPEWMDYKNGVLTFPQARPFSSSTADSAQSQGRHRFTFSFQSRLSIFRLSHRRLLRESETVVVDGDPLSRGDDYVLDYTAGSLLILKHGIIAEDSEIEVRYEYYNEPETADERFSLAGVGFGPSDNVLVEMNGYTYDKNGNRQNGLDMIGEFKLPTRSLDFKVTPELALSRNGNSIHVRTDVSSRSLRLYSEMERNDPDFMFLSPRKIRSGRLRSRQSLGGTVYPADFLDISGSWIRQSAFPNTSTSDNTYHGATDEEEYGGRVLMNKTGWPTISLSGRRKRFESPASSTVKDIVKADLEYDVPKSLLNKLSIQSARFYGILRRSVLDDPLDDMEKQFNNRYFRLDVAPTDLIQINAYYRQERADRMAGAEGIRPLDQNEKWFFDATLDRLSGVNFSSRGESEALTEHSAEVQNITLYRSWQNSLRIYPGKWIRWLSPFILEFNAQPQWNGYLRNQSRNLTFFDRAVRFFDAGNAARADQMLFYQFRGEWRPSALFWYYTSLDWNRIRSQRMDTHLDTHINIWNQKVEIRPAVNAMLMVQYIRNEESKQAFSRIVRHNAFFWLENRWNSKLQTKMNLSYFREERYFGHLEEWMSTLSPIMGLTYRVRSSGSLRLEVRDDLSASFYRSSKTSSILNSDTYSNTAWLDYYPAAWLVLRLRAALSFRDQLASADDFVYGTYELRFTMQF